MYLIILLGVAIFFSGCVAVVPSLQESNNNPFLPQVTTTDKSEHTNSAVAFAPAADILKKDSAEACEIYESSPAPLVSGIYEYKNFIFVITIIDYAKEKVNIPEAAAMLRNAAMLRERYHLPADYSLNCSVLADEDDEEKSIYRRVVVFDTQEVKALAEKFQIATTSTNVDPILKKKTNSVNNIVKVSPAPQKSDKSSVNINVFCGDNIIEEDF